MINGKLAREKKTQIEEKTGHRLRKQETVPKHQAQMLLIPNDIILHGKDQVAQGSIHGVIIKVFLGADKQKLGG